jgi:hypothetical protein
MSSATASVVPPLRFTLLEDEERLPCEYDCLVQMVNHMAQGTAVSRYQGLKHAAMLRFTKDGQQHQIVVKPCPDESPAATEFVCGAASIPDSLAVWYVDGLKTVNINATIHRTVAGHPIVNVTGRGWYCVELKA